MKVYKTDFASVVESIYLGADLTDNYNEADIIVNPNHSNIYNKKIYVNRLDYKMDYRKLSLSNTIVTRFPVNNCLRYTITPYRFDKENQKIQYIGYDTNHVYTPYNIDWIDYEIKNGILYINKPSLATSLTSNGYPNVLGLLVGYPYKYRMNNPTRIKEFIDKYELKIKYFDYDTQITPNISYDPRFRIECDGEIILGTIIKPRSIRNKYHIRNQIDYEHNCRYRIFDEINSYKLLYYDKNYFLFNINRTGELTYKDFSLLSKCGCIDLTFYLLYHLCKHGRVRNFRSDIFYELNPTIEIGNCLDLYFSLLPYDGIRISNTNYISLLGFNKLESIKLH